MKKHIDIKIKSILDIKSTGFFNHKILKLVIKLVNIFNNFLFEYIVIKTENN